MTRDGGDCLGTVLLVDGVEQDACNVVMGTLPREHRNRCIKHGLNNDMVPYRRHTHSAVGAAGGLGNTVTGGTGLTTGRESGLPRSGREQSDRQ